LSTPIVFWRTNTGTPIVVRQNASVGGKLRTDELAILSKSIVVPNKMTRYKSEGNIETERPSLVDKEKAAIEAENPPEIRHTIDRNEPTVIQDLRRHLRMKHNAYVTEKSYVRYAKQFVRRFELVDDATWTKIF